MNLPLVTEMLKVVYATPISFDTNQGIELTDNSQRSFSPNQFNNPKWLLKTNQNQIKRNNFIASLQNKFKVSEDAYFKSILNYTNSIHKERFGLPRSTAGFLEGYVSNKNISSNEFDSNLVFRFEKYMNRSKLKVHSKINYTYNDLDYTFFEAEGFSDFGFSNPQTTNQRIQQLDRSTFRMLHTVAYTIAAASTTITAGNNSFTSSIQNSKWFLPTLEIKTDLDNYIEIDWLNRFTVSASTSFDVNDIPLFYRNQSHNSLLFHPQESLGYIANNDLFISNNINLEEKRNYELGTNIEAELFYGDTYLDVGINVANVSNKGFELSLHARIRNYNDFWYAPGIVFSSYRTKVLDILNENERIPFAGFSSVSKNLIKGQPAGVFVGSAYQRDHQNNLIIDDQGFPMVAPDLKIIGDPTPEYSIGFSNSFNWKKIQFNFLIDFQKGGDVWNGTQNVLNYLGTSQLSAEQREISGFVFSGVNEEGERNTIPVDFANPVNGLSGNKFVRYGFAGVAEDAIVDGSYINLKSVNLTYDLAKNRRNHFIRDFTIGIYANNLFTWSTYRGASPYSNLFDQHSSQGLHFFNTPITSEVGLNINLKI